MTDEATKNRREVLEQAKDIKWSQDVKIKDRWVCTDCGELDRELLESHHTQPKDMFPELAHSLDNGQCLCVACHARVHRGNHVVCNMILARLGVILYSRLYPEKGKKLAELLCKF